MIYKIALLSIVLLIATTGRSFGMLQAEDSDTSDVSSSQPFNFNDPAAVKYTAGVDAHKRWHHWCVVHKVGLGIVTVGGATFLTGALVFATASSSEKNAEFFPTGQALTGIGLELLALLETVAGAPLLIGGSIHDQKKWRYGFVGPKGGLGIAYNF